MKQLTIIFSLCCVSLWAQQPKDLPKELSEQKVQITKLQTQLKVQENTLYLQKQALQKLQTGKDSLAKQLQHLSQSHFLHTNRQCFHTRIPRYRAKPCALIANKNSLVY